eukprot:SAG31_NODE_45865_length_257_cov_0.632911_1_plen_23_part_01
MFTHPITIIILLSWDRPIEHFLH